MQILASPSARIPDGDSPKGIPCVSRPLLRSDSRHPNGCILPDGSGSGKPSSGSSKGHGLPALDATPHLFASCTRRVSMASPKRAPTPPLERNRLIALGFSALRLPCPMPARWWPMLWWPKCARRWLRRVGDIDTAKPLNTYPCGGFAPGG